jgi:hypothetical protein
MKTLEEKLQRLEAMYCISGIEGFTEAVLSLFNKQLQQAGEVAVEEYKKSLDFEKEAEKFEEEMCSGIFGLVNIQGMGNVHLFAQKLTNLLEEK